MSPGTADVFPSLHACTKLQDKQNLYDVKFYPFPTVDDDQVFAVIGDHDLFVLRPKLDGEQPFEVLRWFKDLDLDHAYNSVVWTKDRITRRPLICIAGHTPKQIQIIDVETGTLKQSLLGHGKGINDLAVSPLSTSLIASASEDYTIRLWNLEPKYAKQPCVAVFAGEAHRQPILACHFHPNGRWMLSSGLDTAVCLWAVPTPEELERPDYTIAYPQPKLIYYPHFYSTEIHANYVDNVVFYGDLIFSRSSKDQAESRKSNEILLWRIEGFNSASDPPENPPIPTPGQYTRSSFRHPDRSRGFRRLLTFDMSLTSRFYLRFGLLQQPGMRPILAMGNTESRFSFWDLQKLQEGWSPGEEPLGRKSGSRKPKGRAKARLEDGNLNRLLGEVRMATPGEGTPDPSTTSVSAPPEKKFDLGDPFVPLKAHREILADTSLSAKEHFGTTQIAWSPDGTWMIAAGDRGMLCMFHRDKSVI